MTKFSNHCHWHIRFCFMILALSCLALQGCGPRKIVLVAPGVSLVELIAAPDRNAIDIQLRLENKSELALEITSLQLNLEIDQIPLQTVVRKQPARVATLSSEVIDMGIDYDTDLIRVLDQLSSGDVSRLSFKITGDIVAKSGKQLQIQEQLWINRTPGKPGHFR